jgi:hypothetical protein
LDAWQREGLKDTGTSRPEKPTATPMVEGDCEARATRIGSCSSAGRTRVQRALDILVASGFIAEPTDEDDERGVESG